jgi:hypothetical protein
MFVRAVSRALGRGAGKDSRRHGDSQTHAGCTRARLAAGHATLLAGVQRGGRPAVVVLSDVRALPDPRLDEAHGRVVAGDERNGIWLSLEGRRTGEEFNLPPDTRSFQRARSGEYRLLSTGETVVNPDFTVTFSIRRQGQTRGSDRVRPGAVGGPWVKRTLSVGVDRCAVALRRKTYVHVHSLRRKAAASPCRTPCQTTLVVLHCALSKAYCRRSWCRPAQYPASR